MGRLIAALALAMIAACGASRDRGPAWPTRSEPEVDGGESLAPRTASVVAASEKKADEKKAEPATETKADETKADTTATATATDDTKSTTTTPADDIIIIEDIVIEIED